MGEKCGHITSPTLLLIKSNFGNIFGAYTTVPWHIGDERKHHADPNTFLFVLKSDQKKIKPQIFDIKASSQKSTVFHPGKRDMESPFHQTLVTFGSCAGLSLKNRCNETDTNFCYGGKLCGYDIPKGNMMCGGKAKPSLKALRGSYTFSVDKMEMFEIEPIAEPIDSILPTPPCDKFKIHPQFKISPSDMVEDTPEDLYHMVNRIWLW